MPTEIVYTDEFNAWWDTLTMRNRDAVNSGFSRLRYYGITLPKRHAKIVEVRDSVAMRELRIRVDGRQLRVFYAFDPTATAVVLLGGDKTGDRDFYPLNIPIAFDIYAVHIRRQETEGLL